MFDPKPKTAKPSTKKPKKESSKGSSSRADEKGSRSHAPADDDLGWSEPKYHKYYGLYYVDRYDHESGEYLTEWLPDDYHPPAMADNTTPRDMGDVDDLAEDAAQMNLNDEQGGDSPRSGGRRDSDLDTSRAGSSGNYQYTSSRSGGHEGASGSYGVSDHVQSDADTSDPYGTWPQHGHEESTEGRPAGKGHSKHQDKEHGGGHGKSASHDPKSRKGKGKDDYSSSSKHTSHHHSGKSHKESSRHDRKGKGKEEREKDDDDLPPDPYFVDPEKGPHAEGSSRRSDDSGNAGGSNPQRPGQGRPRRGVRWDEEVQEYGPAEGDIEGVEEDPDWQQVQAEGSYQPSAPLSFGAGEESEPAYGEPVEEPEVDQTAGYPDPVDHIMGTPGTQEALDPRFKIEKSHKFEPGEVFKVLWYEPHGGTPAPGGASLSEKAKLYDHYGQPIYVGFRRFIVIANDEGHCQCVPILTYGKKGCKKRGVKPRTHGIAYAYGSKARPIPGEPDLGFKPIPIKLEVKNEEIKPESRVNYSKLVTVEHNVKVFFIGYVPRESFKIVSNAVTKCWNEKLLTPRDNRERP